MAKFASKYQTLTVLDEDGQLMGTFEGGEFETDDERIARRLRTLDDVEEVGSGSGPSLKSKNKAELLELAKAEDVEGRSEMTKAELIEALSG